MLFAVCCGMLQGGITHILQGCFIQLPLCQWNYAEEYMIHKSCELLTHVINITKAKHGNSALFQVMAWHRIGAKRKPLHESLLIMYISMGYKVDSLVELDALVPKRCLLNGISCLHLWFPWYVRSCCRTVCLEYPPPSPSRASTQFSPKQSTFHTKQDSKT